ncbi:beta-glucosidase-related glycosidase [Micractinium conductrix]|uniref:Beta-glucosidase-related glycosidase n=1 Tax=Micractinium conductrix TaxID=554055 RepID=A0A2P6V3C4_9CHLO|nr:beta-glucosidase-related glycosidase [Micractinium conductrix]|eukprot:PSC68589.1 beta-glucosidase-related glycosidase [Micractinium conductrix]
MPSAAYRIPIRAWSAVLSAAAHLLVDLPEEDTQAAVLTAVLAGALPVLKNTIGGAYIQELSDDPTAMPAAAALGQALHEAAVALPGHAAAARLAPQGRASLRQPVLRQPGGRARAGGHGEAQPAVRCLPHDTVLCRVPRADWGVGGHKLVCLQLKQLAGRS